ncbi:MAG: DNA-3-methyladenine glycosylase I [Gammaproteobacteria bacterium]|nr:DNA-3-methyladenine glycosylase I [Gammaproteobacteria bacterium]
MTAFQMIYEEALLRTGGETILKSKLPVPKSRDELRNLSDHYYLSVMSRRIFRAGLKHSMVDAKWPAFEKVFHGFDIDRVRMMSDEELESLLHDRGIIRHWGKIRAVRENAQSMHELLNEKSNMGDYLADWPGELIVELWDDLKDRFTQLGGNSGPYFLRMAGKDTFLLTRFVVRALIRWGVIETEPGGVKARQVVQNCINQWSEESRRPMCQISMLLALSID